MHLYLNTNTLYKYTSSMLLHATERPWHLKVAGTV